MPPVQKVSHRRSILFFKSPVSISFSLPIPSVGGIAPAAEFDNFAAPLQLGQSTLDRDLADIRAMLQDFGLSDLPKGALDDTPDTVRLAHAVGGQIMFGHDKAGQIFNYHAGSFGYTRFPSFAVPALKAMGLEKEARQITVENPASFLACG